MKSFIKNNKILAVYLICIIVFSFVFTILEFAGISYDFLTKMLLAINLILSFFYSYKNSIRSNLNGYKSGFRSAIKIWLMLLILNLITLNSFTFKTLIYYFIIMLICIISGIIGKNRQKNYSSSNLE